MFGFQFDRVSGQSGLHALVEQFGDPFARDYPLARDEPVPIVTELGLSAGEGGLDVLAGAVVPTHGHRCGLGFDGLGDPRLRRDIRFRRFAGIAYSSACGACLVDEHVVADPVETFGQIPAGHDLTQPEITLRQVGDRLQHEGHRGFAAVGGQAVEQIRHGFAVRRRGLGSFEPQTGAGIGKSVKRIVRAVLRVVDGFAGFLAWLRDRSAVGARGVRRG